MFIAPIWMRVTIRNRPAITDMPTSNFQRMLHLSRAITRERGFVVNFSTRQIIPRSRAASSGLTRIHRWTGMDSMRTAEGGEGVYRRDDPGSNLGRREVGRAVCRRFLGAPMAGLQWLWRARWRDRTRQEALAGLGWREFCRGRWVGWRVSGGRAPSGWEWNGSQSGQGAAETAPPRASAGEDAGSIGVPSG